MSETEIGITVREGRDEIQRSWLIHNVNKPLVLTIHTEDFCPLRIPGASVAHLRSHPTTQREIG